MHTQLIIFTDIKMDWRLVMPHDFDSLRYYITPQLYLVISDIFAPGGVYKIGETFVGKDGSPKQFEQEYLIRCSQERVNKAFTNQELSCFFTIEEATKMEKMFLDNHFRSYNVYIYYRDERIEPHYLPREEFKKLTNILDQMRVMAATPYEGEAEKLQHVHDAYEKRDRMRWIRAREQRGPRSKKELANNGAKGFAFIAAGVGLEFAAKKFLDSRKWQMVVAGVVMRGLAFFIGVLGKITFEKTAQHVVKDVILQEI